MAAVTVCSVQFNLSQIKIFGPETEGNVSGSTAAAAVVHELNIQGHIGIVSSPGREVLTEGLFEDL